MSRMICKCSPPQEGRTGIFWEEGRQFKLFFQMSCTWAAKLIQPHSRQIARHPGSDDQRSHHNPKESGASLNRRSSLTCYSLEAKPHCSTTKKLGGNKLIDDRDPAHADQVSLCLVMLSRTREPLHTITKNPPITKRFELTVRQLEGSFR
jgi:hypothetical protein